MLIVCPSCATSYMIEPASVGPNGRAVRCARCRSTWFVSPSKAAETPNVSAFVNGVIAEAEAESESGKIGSPPPIFEASPSTAPEPPADEPPSLAPDTEARFEPPAAEPSYEPQPYDAESDQHTGADLRAFPDDGAAPPTIADAPSLVPPDDHDAYQGADAATGDSDDNANYASRRARMRAKQQKNKRNSRWTVLILLLFAVNIGIIAGRHKIVRHLPQTASLFASIGLPVNLRNLEFDDIKISKETQDGVSILIIEGKIVNTVGGATDVPRLRFAARNASGQEVYTWSMQPTRSILGPGDSLPFVSRLAAPPADAVDILVRFFTKQDAASGMK